MHQMSRVGETRTRVPRFSSRVAGVAGVAVLLVALVASPSFGQTTYYVPLDSATIQGAYDLASSGDEIIVSSGTYTEHDIIVKSGVSLRSETGAPADVTIDAQNLGRGLSVTGAASGTEIVGVTITNGFDNTAVPDSKGGGILCVNSTLEVRDCIITACQANGDGGSGGFGGGIASSNSSLTLIDCDFINNDAHYDVFGGQGGGLSAEGGDVSATGCLFELNVAGYRGGGIYSTASPAVFTDCDFISNTADNSGGAAYVENSPDFDVCVFDLNSATVADGGAIRGTVGTINGCLFTNNSAGGTGGAVMGSVTTTSYCQLWANSALEGGGAALAGVGEFTNCLFGQNHATAGDGGAVWTILTADYTFTNCTFAENSGTGGCGGICVDHSSQAALDKCIVAFSTSGVGVECQDSGVATLTCTDVYGNDGGDWVGCILGQQGNDFNFSLDPIFCGFPHAAPFSLRNDSPCVAGNNPDCGQVGYVGIGCLGPTIFQSNSEWTWQTPSADGGVTVCPAGDGPDYLEVYVRGYVDEPVEGASVRLSVDSSTFPYVECPVEGVLTDASGRAVLYPRVGLSQTPFNCSTVAVSVWATYLEEPEVRILWDGTDEQDSRKWRSYDLNGDGVVNGASGWGDYGIFETDFNGTACRSDFTGDGAVNMSDLTLLSNHLMNHAALLVSPSGTIDLGDVDEGIVEVRQLTLENWGVTVINWQLTESEPGLEIAPSSGTLVACDEDPPDPDAVATVDFTVNTTGLTPGPHDWYVNVVGSSYECFTDNPIVVSMNVLPPSPFVDWMGGGDGSTWEDANNWDPDQVPGASDHARILQDGTYTIFYNSVSGIYALTHGAMNGVQTLDVQTGTLGVTDGALNTQKIVVRGGATFDATAGGDTALVVNEAGGTFTLDNGDLVGTGTGTFVNRGHVRKTGGGTSHVTIALENQGAARSDGGLVTADAGTLSMEVDGTIDGRLNVNSGATAIVGGHFRVISGDVTIDAGGEFVVAAPETVLLTGTFDVAGGLVVEPGAMFINSSDVAIREGGSLTSEGSFYNEVDGNLINEGLTLVPAGGLLTNDGYFEHRENAILTGSGTVDNSLGTAAIKGLVAPGDEVGMLTFLGDFVQSSTSEISLEIGGYDQGTTYDLLDISGAATLDGAVELSLIGGFVPVLDDSFHLVTHAGAGPGGTNFYCYSGLVISDELYMEPLQLTDEFLLRVVGGSTGNGLPIAADDDGSVTGYQPITIDVLANDTDPDLDVLRVIVLHTETLNGLAYINEDDLLVAYAAIPGFAGVDSFDYVVTDCYGGADTGRVRIDVTAPPEVWNVPDDSPSIVGALALAAPGDTVIVDCGIYYESNVTVPSGVVLMSETGEPDCVIIDASGRAGRVFYFVDADSTTVLRGITATGGSTAELGGGLYCERSSPQVLNCVFETNTAESGGGVACDDNSSPTFVGCRMNDNSATMAGGVYCNSGSSPSFSQCVIADNVVSSSGGGVRCDSLSSPTFENCTVVRNAAPLGGGSGLYAGDDSNLVLDRTIVALGIEGESVVCSGAGGATFTCSDVYGNEGGDWVGCVLGQGAIDDNFSLDPAFCDTAVGDYHLLPASPCADAVGCGLVGALEAGCLEFPEIDVSPTSFTFELAAGGTASDVLEISNLGRSDLIWMIRENGLARSVSDGRSVPVKVRVLPREIATALELVNPEIPHVEVAKGEDDPRVGRGPTRGSGGPDGFGYTWIDSDDPFGPTYNWREISGIGTALTLTDDDHAEVFLPFLFPFYASQKMAVKISSNGYLTFGTYADDYSNDPIPDSWVPNDVVAPFWDDLSPESGGGIYYYHDAVEEEFIVQYDGIYDYFGAGPYTFEVILKPDGSIRFLYDEITGSPTTATVGIENSSGTTGLEIAFDAAYVHAPLAIVIEDSAPWLTEDTPSGATSGLGTSSIVIEVDTEGLAAGIYPVTLVIESDDPDEPEVMIPVTLTIDVVGVDDGLPTRYVLHGSYPNPFNPMTEIRYDLPAPVTVTLRIYSIAGRLVRELVSGERQTPGNYRIPWDGRDDSGERVASGVYFYKLEAGGEALRKRMVLLK